MSKYFLSAIPLLTSLALASFYFETKSIKPSFVSDESRETMRIEQQLEGVEKELLALKKSPGATSYTSRFLSKTMDAYKWLVKQNNKGRYFFLFSIIDTLAIENQAKRHEALSVLLDTEMSRFKSEGFSYSEDKAWSSFVQDMKSAASLMQKAQLNQEASAKSEGRTVENLLGKIQSIKNLYADEMRIENNPLQESAPIGAEVLMVLLGLLGSFISISPKKTSGSQEQASKAPLQQKFDYFEAQKNPTPGVDLGDICHKNLNNLAYMIKTSDIPVIAKRKIPCTDRLMIDNDTMNEAVNSLLRGILVLAQNQNQDSLASLEWNYDIDPSRAMVEFQLNGKEYSLSDFEKNHQLLEDGSISSQFARAQNKLAHFRPVIQVLPKDGNTKITLSLDVTPQDQVALHH